MVAPAKSATTAMILVKCMVMLVNEEGLFGFVWLFVDCLELDSDEPGYYGWRILRGKSLLLIEFWSS